MKDHPGQKLQGGRGMMVFVWQLARHLCYNNVYPVGSGLLTLEWSSIHFSKM